MSFDLSNMIAATPNTIKVQPQLTELPFGKANGNAFFQVKTGEGWNSPFMYIYDSKENGMDGHPYLCDSSVAPYLDETGLLRIGKFYLLILYGSGIMRLDFINLRTDKRGKMNKYNESKQQIYEGNATTDWVRMRSVTGAGYYSIALPEQPLPLPVWPKKPANIMEAIQLGFEGYIINSIDHPEIKLIRGVL